MSKKEKKITCFTNVCKISEYILVNPEQSWNILGKFWKMKILKYFLENPGKYRKTFLKNLGENLKNILKNPLKILGKFWKIFWKILGTILENIEKYFGKSQRKSEKYSEKSWKILESDRIWRNLKNPENWFNSDRIKFNRRTWIGFRRWGT